MNKAGKVALLTKFVQGKLTVADVNNIRKSREPMFITMDLGNGENPLEPNAPTYHIEIYDNWSYSRCYWQYADGRREYRNT
jgi:hypothetical protein